MNASTTYSLHGHTLQRVLSAKYLGVTLQTDLSWVEHVDNTCAKANRALGFLRRNLKVCSKSTKELAYKALVRPIVEYASTVWDPYTDRQASRLEKIQRRAARFVLNRHRNTSSVSDMLHQLQWPSLEERRRIARLSMLYKIKHEEACVQCPALKALPPSGRRSQHSQPFKRIPCRTDYRNNTFFPRTIRDWNALPPETVQSPTLDTFLRRVSKH